MNNNNTGFRYIYVKNICIKLS